MSTLAFLYFGPDPFPPSPPSPISPLFLFPHTFPAASSPHTSLRPPVPAATCRSIGRCCARTAHAGDADIAPAAWRFGGAKPGGGWGWGVRLAGLSRGAGCWAGIALEVEGTAGTGREGMGVLVVPMPEGAGVAGGDRAAQHPGTGVRGTGLVCWEMSVQRAGAVLPAASAPLLAGRPPLDQSPSSPALGRGAGTPLRRDRPWSQCRMEGGNTRVTPSQAQPGASGVFLIISAWVTRGIL